MDIRSRVLRRAGASGMSALFVATALLIGPIVPTVAADATIGTTTALGPSEVNPKPVGRTSDIFASLTLDSGAGPTGTMTLFDDNGVTRTQIDQKPVSLNVQFTLAADMAEGTYHLVAVYSGDATFIESESNTVTITVGPRPTSTTPTLASTHDGTGATAQKGDAVYVTPNVLDTGDHLANDIPLAGDVTVELDGVLKATITASQQAELSTSSWSLGSHTIKVTYAGDGVDHSGSNGSVSITILANVVEATGVGVSAPTFYPYRDGYRDTVGIRGNRGETISTVIRIYSPTGKVVRTFSVAAGTGAYSVAWNGRTATGTVLAAGKYKVVQTLSDTATPKATKAFTSYVTISAKRLYTSTTYVNKLGSSYTAKGAGGGGSVTRSTSAGWVKLAAGSSGSGYAAAGWELVLPAATVYKAIAWQVYAKYPLSTSPTGIGMQNFTWCPRSSTWSDGCFDHWRAIGNGAYTATWYSTSGSVTVNRSGRYVRGIVEGVFDTTWVYKVRVKVTYAVLK